MIRKPRWTGLVAAAALALAACGGDDEDDGAGEPSAVRVLGVEYAFAMPDRVEGGIVTMDFANAGKELHEFALGRLDPGRTLADLDEVLARGEEPPEWVQDVAGVPAMTPGERISITRRLRPGTYVFLCFIPAPNGKPHYELGMKHEFKVAGDSGAALPEVDGVVIARDNGIDVPEVGSGRQTLELRNSASGPREFQLVTFEPGKTPRDAEQWFQGGFKGKPPLKILGAMQSIPPGTSVFLTARFESGRAYFFSDEENRLRTRFTVR